MKTMAPWIDEILSHVLRDTEDIISEPLANIFKKAFGNVVILEIWTKVNVALLLKKGG